MRLQRLLHCHQRNPQRGQLGVGNLDPDFFILQANQLHLAHVVDSLQGKLQTVGIVFHDGVVETLAGERVDIAEGGTELVIEEWTAHILRQGVADIAHFLAHLVPQIIDIG